MDKLLKLLRPWDIVYLNDNSEPVILVPYSLYKIYKDDAEQWQLARRKKDINDSDE